MGDLYTIGHSSRTTEELIEILLAWKIGTVVDIRQFTRSRRNPQFNDDVLAPALAVHGIDYVALAGLGGRRGKAASPTDDNAGWLHAAFRNYADHAGTETFRDAFDRLLALAARSTCAVMCAEAVWWRCHRRIVADHALASGLTVWHVFSADKVEPAEPTPFARVVRRGGRPSVVYPAAEAASRSASRVVDS